MPAIPTYDVPAAEQRLNIPEGGSATLGQAARRMGTMGNEASSAIKAGWNSVGQGLGAIGAGLDKRDAATAQAEVGKAPLLIAKDQSGRLNDLNNMAMTTDPSQITGKVGQYIDENMGDAKEAYMANFTTKASKAHAETLWNDHEANIYNHATAMSIQASHDQNHENLVGTVNTLAQTAGAHPSTMDANLGLIDQTIDAQLPNIPAAQRAAFDTTFRNEAKAEAFGQALKTMAFGSADGSIRPNPEGARTLLDSGKYDDFIGKHKEMLHQTVDLGMHQVQQDAQTNAAHADFLAQQRSDGATQQYFSQLPTISGQAAPNFGLRVLHDDSILPEDKTALINVSRALSTGAAPATNPATSDHMLTRLTSGDRPSTAQLLNQVTAGNLSMADAQFFMGQDPNNPALHQLRATINEGKASLSQNNGSGFVSPAASVAYNRFQQFAMNAYKSGNPIDASSMPDVLARFRPTHEDAAAAIPASARPGGVMVPGGVLNHPPTEEMLPHVAMAESGDRNIKEVGGPAEGYYQIEPPTWRDFAPQAGVSLAQYPNPLAAPKEIQAQVAKVIPLRRWAPATIRALANRGLLAGGRPGVGGRL